MGRGQVKWDFVRQKRPRIHARTWQFKTSYDLQGLKEARAEQNIKGSLEERMFYRALVEHGFIPGVDFTFQSAMMGGRAELGGLVADFLFEIPKIIVNPMSYWHTMSLVTERRDDDQTVILRSLGYTQLEIWPITIYDQYALDKWINDNLGMLWGTSTSGSSYGNGGIIASSSGAGGISQAWAGNIEINILNQINTNLDAILERVK